MVVCRCSAKALKSGREGRYPDLERVTEERVRELDPHHRVLRSDKPILRTAGLDKDARKAVEKELQAFEARMGSAPQGPAPKATSAARPPIRGQQPSPPGACHQTLRFHATAEAAPSPAAASAAPRAAKQQQQQPARIPGCGLNRSGEWGPEGFRLVGESSVGKRPAGTTFARGTALTRMLPCANWRAPKRRCPPKGPAVRALCCLLSWAAWGVLGCDRNFLHVRLPAFRAPTSDVVCRCHSCRPGIRVAALNTRTCRGCRGHQPAGTKAHRLALRGRWKSPPVPNTARAWLSWSGSK